MFLAHQSQIVTASLASTIVVLLTNSAAAQNLPSPTESMTIGESIVGTEQVSNSGAISSPAYVQAYSDNTFPDLTTWLNPTRWFIGPTWEKGIELGINGSKGNAQAFSLLAASGLRRETDRSIVGIDAVYAKTKANNMLTQEYAFFNLRLDYKLGDSRWSLFNITRLEHDKFKAFNFRLAINGGIGYELIRTDSRKLTGRFGTGASGEFGGVSDEWIPEAVFGADYTHKISDRQRLSITSDYYPSWDDFVDYRMVTQASWELLLDEETNLSLKIGLLDRYDSTPLGLRPNDVDYFIALLWKM